MRLLPQVLCILNHLLHIFWSSGHTDVEKEGPVERTLLHADVGLKFHHNGVTLKHFLTLIHSEFQVYWHVRGHHIFNWKNVLPVYKDLRYRAGIVWGE